MMRREERAAIRKLTERFSGRGAFRQLYVKLRTEWRQPRRQAGAVGCGVFIGMTPLYGLHLALCIGVASLLRLNRITTYLAAHIGNPLSAPVIVYLEVQVGHWIRTGAPHPHRLSTFEAQAVWDIVRTFSGDLLVGVPLVASVTAVVAGALTYSVCQRQGTGTPFDTLVERTAARYEGLSVFDWEWVRAKLRVDPVYRCVVEEKALLRGHVVDLGCGRGHLLALLEEARLRDRGSTTWTSLCGIERRNAIADRARAALGNAASIVTGDVTQEELPPADTYLLLDVLHYLPTHSQERLVHRIAARLLPSGVLIIREADRRVHLGYLAVVVAETLCALVKGDWRSRRHYRASAEWVELLEKVGLVASARPMGAGTPFANTLVVGRREY